jgi:hypothetical protein
MTEDELRAVQEFATLPVESEDAADYLTRPDGPEFSGVIYEAEDVTQLRDFLRDKQLVPKGAYRDEFGKVRAVFWQRR